MFSFLILTKSLAIPMPGWLLALGIMIAAALGACAQWIASARTKKQAVTRASVLVGGSTLFFYMIIDCGPYIWTWLCAMV